MKTDHQLCKMGVIGDFGKSSFSDAIETKAKWSGCRREREGKKWRRKVLITQEVHTPRQV